MRIGLRVLLSEEYKSLFRKDPLVQIRIVKPLIWMVWDGIDHPRLFGFLSLGLWGLFFGSIVFYCLSSP